MTIKKKLIINTLVVVIAMMIVVGSAIIGTRSINDNITQLTEKTTPHQLKALRHQQQLQAHATNLILLSAAINQVELNRLIGPAQDSLRQSLDAAEALANIHGRSYEGDKVITEITTSIIENVQHKTAAAQEVAGSAISIKKAFRQLWLK